VSTDLNNDITQDDIDKIRAGAREHRCCECEGVFAGFMMEQDPVTLQHTCFDCIAKHDDNFDGTDDKTDDRQGLNFRLKDDPRIPNPHAHITDATSSDAFRNSAKQVLLRRELARRRLLPFIQEFKVGYMAGWVHKDICARLEKFSKAVERGESPRLMLFMPPRSGKSEIISRNFPAWHLGQFPDHEIIACSYAASLANSFSRKVRDILRDPAYHSMFDTRLDKESQAVENWLTNGGGGYVSAGVGGSIVGKGAHVLLIDDPTKGRDEAKSESVQESIRDWYTGSAYTRLTSGGGVLIIMQRWAEDDLAGWLLQNDEENDFIENWQVVRYPAIAEEDEDYRNRGEALHPDRYDEKAFKRIRATLGERDWHALFQQNPLPDTGDFFKKDMFTMVGQSEVPPLDELKVYAAWDLAVGQKEVNDFSVGVYVGVDERAKIWILHVEKCKMDTLELCTNILDLHVKYNPIATGMEHGQISLAIGPFMEVLCREKEIFPYFEPLKPGRNDKEARANNIRGRMQQHMVLFPKGNMGVSELISECLKFPNGKHDDAVDALSYIGILLNTLSSHKPLVKEKKEGWKDKFLRTQLALQEGGDGTTWMAS
jgi:predicted phage terminase large subunit-like protein